MYNSMLHHKKENLDSVSTIADGIAVKCPGELTYEFCSKYVDEIVTVTDDEISSAILTPVSYTHLDVYKRQACFPTFFPTLAMRAEFRYRKQNLTG